MEWISQAIFRTIHEWSEIADPGVATRCCNRRVVRPRWGLRQRPSGGAGRRSVRKFMISEGPKSSKSTNFGCRPIALAKANSGTRRLPLPRWPRPPAAPADHPAATARPVASLQYFQLARQLCSCSQQQARRARHVHRMARQLCAAHGRISVPPPAAERWLTVTPLGAFRRL